MPVTTRLLRLGYVSLAAVLTVPVTVTVCEASQRALRRSRLGPAPHIRLCPGRASAACSQVTRHHTVNLVRTTSGPNDEDRKLGSARRNSRKAINRTARMDQQNNSTLLKGAAIGTGLGSCLGALVAFYRGSPIATPTVMGGGVGALSIGTYYSSWHFLRNQSQFDNPGIHFVSGSVSGYLMAAFTAGPKAINFGILCGGSTGIGVYYALTAFENWRVRTGIQMAMARQSPVSPDIRIGVVANKDLDSTSETVENQSKSSSSSWYEWLPIRKISDEEAAALLEERKRVHEIR